MAKIAALVAALSLLGLAGAQTVADLLAQLPACATLCATETFNSSNCATWDVVCACQSSTFLPANSPCLIDSCSASDIQAGESIWNQICAKVSITTGASSTAFFTAGPSTDLEAHITTTDVYNNTFTVTGLLLSSGSNTTFVPYHTVVTRTSNGVVITQIMNITSTLPSSSSTQQYNSTATMNATTNATVTMNITQTSSILRPTSTSSTPATASSTSLASKLQQHWVIVLSSGLMFLYL